MIFGFGFGNPLVSLLMLVGTSLLSYLIYRATQKNNRERSRPTRAELRNFYYEQRRRARELSTEFDLTDDEIEQKLDREIGPPAPPRG
ncbi:hypothetical protein [Ferroacidibacillus organovorans]|uniref:Uncharacterized protein n=1 Tax=Ferroacidibacillus organovorans TaxID=1765683 RepID=A0A162RUL5_9BACL|nr:hypothetical protein [Ferroacidibacillus organovorans]KYP79271.1 hypothetical protein AYJ22_04400 [Ferroacidibacillus organovorans]OAG95283.1 hypothetical protein AYW79_01030 [Ferroacidibacillus organovorans]OPG17172.1 hypothetical protein B2M26_02215 [Ferroacidibacillus organovorans]